MGSRSVEPASEEGTQASHCPYPVQTRSGLTPEGLPRAWRVTRQAEFEAVFAQGARRRFVRLDLAWRPNDMTHPRLGLIVPRHGQTAVARNRLRRRLRELARRRGLRALPPLDVVIRARPPAYTAPFEELGAELDQWLQSLST